MLLTTEQEGKRSECRLSRRCHFFLAAASPRKGRALFSFAMSFIDGAGSGLVTLVVPKQIYKVRPAPSMNDVVKLK